MQNTALVAAVLLLAAAGCDLFGSDAQGCSQALSTPEVGKYVLRVTDDDRCRTYPPGRASMDRTPDRGLRPVVYFQFGSFGDEATDFFMAKQAADSLAIEEALPERSYPVADLEHADPVYPGRFDTYEEQFSMSGWDNEGDKFYSRSGTVTIAEVSADLITGSFSTTLQWNGTSDQMKVEGRFKAQRAQLGWLGFW